MTLPAYISDRGHGEISFSVPLEISDVTVWSFALSGDTRQLQAFIDSQLNAVSDGAVRYEPVSFLGRALIFHAYLDAKHCTSSSEVVGWLPDRESAFLVPVWQRRQGDIFPELKTWVPYLLINQQAGMVTGREVWGYRKSLATIEVPAGPNDPGVLSATTTIFKTLDPATQGQLATLLTARRISAPVASPSVWNSFEEAGRAVVEKVLGNQMLAGLLGQGLEAFFKGLSINVINLKQFRDAIDSTRACYSALVQSPCRLDAWKGGGFLNGDFEIEITTCDSHQIARDLGLGTPPAGGGPLIVTPNLAWWAHVDFSTPPGQIVWS
jgi:hypothetical protein